MPSSVPYYQALGGYVVSVALMKSNVEPKQTKAEKQAMRRKAERAKAMASKVQHQLPKAPKARKAGDAPLPLPNDLRPLADHSAADEGQRAFGEFRALNRKGNTLAAAIKANTQLAALLRYLLSSSFPPHLSAFGWEFESFG